MTETDSKRRTWIGLGAAMVIVGGALLALAVLGRSEETAPRQDAPDEQAGVSSTTLPPAPTTTTTAPDGIDPLRLLPSQDRAVDAGCEEAVDVDPPAADLADIVRASEPGTCFRLAAGEYRFRDVVPKDLMSFIGSAPGDVIVRGDADAENAFHGTAHGVTIAGMTVTGFQGSGGEKRQEQAPIRATSSIWASDRGQMATDWLVQDIVSSDNFASGILIGDHFTVRGSRFEDNGVTGISGSEVVGGLIEQNLVTGNGAEQAGGFEINGGGMKFGETGFEAEPLVIRDNDVGNNVGTGIWCDIGCRGFHVIDNYIHDQSSRAVKFELSRNAVISGNTIIDANEWADFSRDFNSGAITIGESSSVVIDNNYIEGAESAITIRQTARPVRPQESFLDNYEFIELFSSDIVVSNNTVRDAQAIGISTGVSGVGLIPDPDSIRFERNTYDQPDDMAFWWNNGERLDFDAWTAAGRDAEPGTPIVPDLSPAAKWADVAEIEVPTREPVELPLFVNAGGGEHVSASGAVFQADDFFVGGEATTHDVTVINGTDDAELYRSERWGLDGYSIPVADGTYRIQLHHAEVFDGCSEPGCRVFSVEVEGVPAAVDLDLVDEVGARTALVLDVVVDVSDGTLDIVFQSSVQEPQISALSVEPDEA